MVLHYVLQKDGAECIGKLRRENARYVVLSPWIRTAQLAEVVRIPRRDIDVIKRVRVRVGNRG